MVNLKEIKDKITEWEDEAEEAAINESDAKSMDEVSLAIDEHIQDHHGEEIEDLIRELTQRQAGIGSANDELTPDSQKEDDIQEDEAIEKLLDTLRKYKK